MGDAWLTLYSGSTIYAHVHAAHPNIYTEAVEQGGFFEFYRQIVRAIPEDVSMYIAIFFSSIWFPVMAAAILYVVIMPFIQKPRTWR